ncbi:hypothetical protein [Achromobacter sp. DH1f]|uniref:hypothetical protein n=1 Tax=Achromobacter sp. DH1f TaxID=1397275 RepID=UPI00046A0F54|nr:hypothetical protein [Achromobacter sp. DH1f]
MDKIRANDDLPMTFDEVRVIQALSYHLADQLHQNFNPKITVNLNDLLKNTAHSALDDQDIQWLAALLGKTWRFSKKIKDGAQVEFFQLATQYRLVDNGHSLHIQLSPAAITVLGDLIQNGTFSRSSD